MHVIYTAIAFTTGVTTFLYNRYNTRLVSNLFESAIQHKFGATVKQKQSKICLETFSSVDRVILMDAAKQQRSKHTNNRAYTVKL